MNFVLRPGTDAATDALGGKARALAALHDAGLPIPPWFVLTPAAFFGSLSSAQREALLAAGSERDPDGEQLRVALQDLRPGAGILAELMTARAGLCPPTEFVAVRSSAADEDGAAHSFAGQLDSFLFVPGPLVAERVATVWRSAFSPRMFAYRRERGLAAPPAPPAVLIQRMVNADAAGVAFSADPVSGRRGVAVVAAVPGLGTALVAGAIDADTFHVDRQGAIIARAVARKPSAHRPAPETLEGVAAIPLPPEQVDGPALDDAGVLAAAALARRCESLFHCPQDIEWAQSNGQIHLLQSRPITSLTGMPDPDGAYCLWDNSNIAESYCGITTPLTFSFARRAYEEVYRQFCRIMVVPETVIQANAGTFRRMLGLVRGHIYYNLLSWYRALALLPGFTFNHRFMEQMMGVRESLPEQVKAAIQQEGGGRAEAGWLRRWADGLRLLQAAWGLVISHLTVRRRIAGFYRRLNQALGTVRPDMSDWRADELTLEYRRLEGQLLSRWDAPLVNDFLAMIFFGVLRKLAANWCGDTAGSLPNDLLCGEGGMVSAEPPARLLAMAELAAQTPELAPTLARAPLPVVLAALEATPELRAQYHAYLERFGDRCLDELKLESLSLHDDPELLLRSVGRLALSLAEHRPAAPDPGGRGEAALRQQAEGRVRQALPGRFLKALVFRWVLANARARVRDRENLRFERTRVFGRVRMICVELGRRFYAAGLLDHPRDVFYLEIDEVLGAVEGTATIDNLRGLAAARRAEYDGYRGLQPPPDRLETRGMVCPYGWLRPTAGAGEPGNGGTVTASPGDQARGTGCCPGVVRGRVRVVTDPQQAGLLPGEILVAERTDPGWIMLFPIAAGLLVERGSLLSHAAIVSREMGIPAVVALAGATRWLRTGDWVEMNGSTGEVVFLNATRTGGDPVG